MARRRDPGWLRRAQQRREETDARHAATTTQVRRCRECGCTDEYGCDGGCSWVEADLCSACRAGGD